MLEISTPHKSLEMQYKEMKLSKLLIAKEKGKEKKGNIWACDSKTIKSTIKYLYIINKSL